MVNTLQLHPCELILSYCQFTHRSVTSTSPLNIPAILYHCPWMEPSLQNNHSYLRVCTVCTLRQSNIATENHNLKLVNYEWWIVHPEGIGTVRIYAYTHGCMEESSPPWQPLVCHWGHTGPDHQASPAAGGDSVEILEDDSVGISRITWKWREITNDSWIFHCPVDLPEDNQPIS